MDADGRVLPTGPVGIEVEGRARRTGVIDASRSSPLGPHKRGLVVRIAIEGGGEDVWPDGGAVTLTWADEGVTFRLACVVPGGAAPGSLGA